MLFKYKGKKTTRRYQILLTAYNVDFKTIENYKYQLYKNEQQNTFLKMIIKM